LFFGCAEEPDASLEAVLGCGLELEGEFSELRVVVRGDFTPGADETMSLGPEEVGMLPALSAEARGVTVEGLVGSYTAALGRTESLEGDPLHVYFAPPDSLCSVPSTVESRQPGAMAAGDDGRVLIVGGRFLDGAMSDEIIEVDLHSGVVRVLDEQLPDRTDGQTLHALGGGRYMMLGGAHRGSPWHSGLQIDLDQDPAVASQASNLLVDGAVRGVAYQAALSLPDGRVWVMGGCRSIDQQGRCSPEEGGAADVTAETFALDPAALQEAEVRGSLNEARHGAHAMMDRSGVAYVAGGFDGQLEPVLSVERARKEEAAWKVVTQLAEPVAGAAVLEGGLLVFALTDGSVAWYSEDAGEGTLAAGAIAPPLEAFSLEGPSLQRPLLGLAGERVLVDAHAFVPGTTDPLAPAWTDLVTATPGTSPGQRRGARMLPLSDGTVLYAGGVERDAEGSTIAARPFLLRLRPPLDGADEHVPDVAGPESRAFVTNAPGTSFIAEGEVVMATPDSDAGIADWPPVRAHVRGFRSRNFRFGFRVANVDADAVPFTFLEHGSDWQVAIALGGGRPTVVKRSFGGGVDELACQTSSGALDLDLELSMDGEALRLRAGEEELVRCPLAELGLPTGDPSVGLGVGGDGAARFDRLRLSRN
jgi:hypothetical protein